jgi:prepilin-type processing-associated H-X9-DG protein
LCVDTCTALDIMRDPTRKEIRPHERQSALDLLSLIEKSGLASLVADQVSFEFQEHAQSVQEEAENALTKIRDLLIGIDDIAAVFGAAGRTNLSHLDGHVARCRKIADRWMAASLTVLRTPDITSRAFGRVNRAITPARRGKDSMKDCVVIETYLDIISTLRAAGLQTPIVFASSNTDDYAQENSSRLKPDLAAEFAGLKIEYAPNLAAAKHLLGF